MRFSEPTCTNMYISDESTKDLRSGIAQRLAEVSPGSTARALGALARTF